MPSVRQGSWPLIVALALAPRVGRAAEQDTPATATAAASAASTAKAKALKSEGDALMVKLRYADALAKYDEAYALSADPVMLYNSGRALEAIDLADLTDGMLAHAIDQTESGSMVAPIATQCSTDAPVHTGTAPDGSFDQASKPNPMDSKFDCGDWTSGGPTDERLLGDARSTTSNWSLIAGCLNAGVFCTIKPAHLYCFEQ